jgi:23S rRNA pseudouridine955/2504/2580 synthase
MFLHAFRLKFEHPATGDAISLESRLPKECQQFLKGIGIDGVVGAEPIG